MDVISYVYDSDCFIYDIHNDTSLYQIWFSKVEIGCASYCGGIGRMHLWKFPYHGNAAYGCGWNHIEYPTDAACHLARHRLFTWGSDAGGFVYDIYEDYESKAILNDFTVPKI